MKIDLTIGEYRFFCSNPKGCGRSSVYIFRNGKLIIHESWTKMPTEEEAKMYLEVFNGEKK